MSPFTQSVIELILEIPEGKVATYGQIAALCGHPKAPRQVAGILKRYSQDYQLPWHRVIGSKGYVSIREVHGRTEQIERLREEDVEVLAEGYIDLDKFGWRPVIRR